MGVAKLFQSGKTVASTWAKSGHAVDDIVTGLNAAHHGSNLVSAATQGNKSIRERIGDMAGHADQLLAVAAGVPFLGEVPDAVRLATSAVHIAGSHDLATAAQRTKQHAASIAVDAVPGLSTVNDLGMVVTKDHTDFATHLTSGATNVASAEAPAKTPELKLEGGKIPSRLYGA